MNMVLVKQKSKVQRIRKRANCEAKGLSTSSS